jgi:molybdenum cofactor cytidylyltransferase
VTGETSPATRAAGVVLLAAGAATRMGVPKQLLVFGGRTLLRRAAEEALASACGPVVVVLGARAARLGGQLAGLPLRTVVNEAWGEGMGSSVRAGVRALADAPEVDAAILAVCDQPFLSADVLRELAAEHRRSGRAIVASSYGGILGVPALFHRSCFRELLALEGREGARRVIEAHAHEAASVPFPLGAVDIDTPEDFARLTARAFPRYNARPAAAAVESPETVPPGAP